MVMAPDRRRPERSHIERKQYDLHGSGYSRFGAARQANGYCQGDRPAPGGNANLSVNDRTDFITMKGDKRN
ncbi:hypothetical protein [Mesorhizobium sp.]|uniref:hypothetical protein n=2 Tax=Mesorhizobium sp. TaxID=1871066 RepID=UPI00257F974A|nr:hypothetical protein [Mesorhizobium sp.]